MNNQSNRCSYDFCFDAKELRKMGVELGYGATMGACKAALKIYICLGIAMAAYKIAQKRVKITKEVIPNEPETEEPAEK